MSSEPRESISEEKKALIIQAHRELVPIKVISRLYQVKENTIRSIVFRFLKNGVISKKRKGRSKKLNETQISAIKEWLWVDCQRSLDWICDKVKDTFDIEIFPTTASRYIDDFCFSYKRILPIPVRRNTDDTKEVRRDYAVRFFEMDRINRENIYFIDETGIAIHCRTIYGRSLRGERANLRVPAIKGKNFSICAAMSSKCLYYYEAKETPYEHLSFADFLTQLFAYFRRDRKEHVFIVMDNVRFHHHDEVQAIFDDSPHEVVFLPPYSPFLNPIENMFNQLKHYVKLGRPKNAEEVFAGVTPSSEVVCEADCQTITQTCLNIFQSASVWKILRIDLLLMKLVALIMESIPLL